MCYYIVKAKEEVSYFRNCLDSLQSKGGASVYNINGRQGRDVCFWVCLYRYGFYMVITITITSGKVFAVVVLTAVAAWLKIKKRP